MLDFRKSLIDSTLRKVLKRLHYPLEVMLTCVRWYVAYPLSLRHVEEMMQERGVFVDHSTVHRWAIKMLPVLAAVFRRRKRPVGGSWRMDETYIKVSGKWKYLLSHELKLYLQQLTASEGGPTFWVHLDTTLRQSQLT